jgi:hypothetical protein
MRKHWLLTSALIGVFFTGSLALGSTAAAAQQVTLKTDKPEYQPGNNLVLTAEVVRGMNPKKATLWLTSADRDAHEENGIINLDFEALLKRGGSDGFRVPKSPGEWTLELHDLSKGSYMSPKTFVTKVSFKVVKSQDSNSAPEAASTARAKGDADTPREAGPASTSPYIKMVDPRALVLGAEFQVHVVLHTPPRIEDKQSASIEWAVATGPNNGWTKEHLEMASLPSTPSVPDGAGKTTATVSLLAPHHRPGNYELHLKYGDRIVGTLPVKVDVGEAQLSELNKVYGPGERIEFKVTLPKNRYYYSIWSGPSATILPKKVGDRTFSKTDLLNPTSALSSTSIGQLGWKAGTTSKHESGPAFQGDMTYSVVHSDKRIGDPLFAPKEPGIYELRFYDRGAYWEWERYFDIPMATHEFEVKAAGPDLRFVSKCSAEEQNSKELKELVHDAVSFLAARIDIVAGVVEATEKTSTLKFVEDGRVKTTMVKLKRVAPGFYCSDPIVPVAPAEPHRSERRS